MSNSRDGERRNQKNQIAQPGESSYNESMRHFPRQFVRWVILVALLGCRHEPPVAPPANQADAAAPKRFEKVRGAAVAGIFYPANAADLEREVDHLLAEATNEHVENLRALVCPHAGYEFSALTASIGYKQLAGRDISTVILLGPSHYAAFEGAFVSSADAYETPLGMVPVSPEAADLAKTQPFTANPQCRVDRPQWWSHSPLKAPPLSGDTPETWEHSLEAQLPFLQRSLHDFSVVPVVFGAVVAPRKVANGLLPLLDARTLIVVSTDLSHFQSYEKAKTLDARTVKAICDLKPDELTEDSACGYGPVLTLMDIARRKGWRARPLDLRNSGDTAGGRTSVVGYAAIAFFDPKPAATNAPPQFTPSERRFLLELARKSVTAAVTGSPPPKEDADVPQKLQARRACFVTLTRSGELRGCIGTIFPQESLYQAVVRRARSAAVEDTRFPPVAPEELKDIAIEVSVLTVPKPLRFASPQDLLNKLRPGIDGVVLNVEGRQSTYLPQVWQQLPDRRLFMRELSQKAGLAADAWTQPGVSVMTYQVEAFRE
jgi:MEMO1 family protein